MGNRDSAAPVRRNRFIVAIIGLVAAGAVIAIFVRNQRHDSNQKVPTLAALSPPPRIVAMTPEATDILESIGCGDHLVAVTSVDYDPKFAALPRVGDYYSTDWETIATLHPAIIITHYGPGQTPAGFVQHADAIGARQINLTTDTLNGPDESSTIYHAISVLGQLCDQPSKAAEAAEHLRSRLAAVHHRVSGEKTVPTLIVIGPEGTMAAGRDTFLSELLEIAGGSNVAAGLSARYPQIDREQIVALHPEVIVQLVPRESPQVIAQAKSFWATLPDVPAVKNNRVVQLTEWYVLLPGYHVGDVAEEITTALHPHAVAK